MTRMIRTRIGMKPVRILVALAFVFLAVAVGMVLHAGTGTPCSLEIFGLPFTCPLGFLQAALAGKDLLSEAWLSVGLSLVAVVLLGRVFCGWFCPTALLRDIFGRRKRAGATQSPPIRAGVAEDGSWKAYSPYAVLGGALLSSLFFGFPVFCLICPVGLFFGTAFAVYRLFTTLEPSWGLLVFPALLAVELLVLKRWCKSLCPLGALLSLISRLNVFGRPEARQETCRTAQGSTCGACEEVCPEGIHLVSGEGGAPESDCTKCMECWEKCPANAIKMRLLSLSR